MIGNYTERRKKEVTVANSDDEAEISCRPGMSSKHKKDNRMDLSKLAYKFTLL